MSSMSVSRPYPQLALEALIVAMPLSSALVLAQGEGITRELLVMHLDARAVICQPAKHEESWHQDTHKADLSSMSFSRKSMASFIEIGKSGTALKKEPTSQRESLETFMTGACLDDVVLQFGRKSIQTSSRLNLFRPPVLALRRHVGGRYDANTWIN